MTSDNTAELAWTAPGPASAPDRVMSRHDAARQLCALFLANAEHGCHAANDELVAELTRRIRARQQAADTTPASPGESQRRPRG